MGKEGSLKPVIRLINTTVSRFTRDALINVHDAYMTVELYNNYYICVILHALSRGGFVKTDKQCLA